MMTVKRLLLVGGLSAAAIALSQCEIAQLPPPDMSPVRLDVTSDPALGKVTSDLAGIDCGSTCGADFPQGITVILTASPLPGVDTAFLGWSGACTNQDEICTVTMDQSRSVTAQWKMPTLPDMAMPVFPAPTVTAVSPANVANNAATPLTITGTNFRAGATVSVGGVACNQVTVVSATKISCTYPGKAATCGGQAITVTHPDDLKSGNLVARMGLFLRSATFSFGMPSNSAIGAGPRMAAIGDVNGDLKLDIAVPNANSDNVSVLLGNGNGSLGSTNNFALGGGTGPQSAAIADFNGDNKADLVVSNATPSNISVLLGNGAGGFGSPTNFGAGSIPSSVVVADVKGV